MDNDKLIPEEGFYISPGELATFMEKDKMIRRKEMEKLIFSKFKDKTEFQEYIKKPKRPSYYKVKPNTIPDHCEICTYYGDMSSFDMDKCVLFPEWPISRARWGVCKGFKKDDDKVNAKLTCR